MEYTKDIILDARYKRKIDCSKLTKGTKCIKRTKKKNGIVFITLNLLSILIMIDLILVNSFLQLLSSIY